MFGGGAWRSQPPLLESQAGGLLPPPPQKPRRDAERGFGVGWWGGKAGFSIVRKSTWVEKGERRGVGSPRSIKSLEEGSLCFLGLLAGGGARGVLDSFKGISFLPPSPPQEMLQNFPLLSTQPSRLHAWEGVKPAKRLVLMKRGRKDPMDSKTPSCRRGCSQLLFSPSPPTSIQFNHPFGMGEPAFGPPTLPHPCFGAWNNVSLGVHPDPANAMRGSLLIQSLTQIVPPSQPLFGGGRVGREKGSF